MPFEIALFGFEMNISFVISLIQEMNSQHDPRKKLTTGMYVTDPKISVIISYKRPRTKVRGVLTSKGNLHKTTITTAREN